MTSLHILDSLVLDATSWDLSSMHSHDDDALPRKMTIANVKGL